MLGTIESPRNIFYAGRSERRTLALKQLPSVKEVFSFDGGPEENIGDVRKITHAKMDHVLPRVKELMGGVKEEDLLVAADSRTEILVHDEHGDRNFESKGKPRNLEDVLVNFLRMSFVAKEIGFAAYQVRSASALLDSAGQRTEDLDLCKVRIKKSGIEHLSTSNGFDEYLQAFSEFYSSGAYVANQLSAIGPRKISGGISLPVLRQMGMVESVNKIEQNLSREAAEAFKLGLWTVAVGFGPAILEKVHPDSLAIILAWDWLNEVTAKVLV